jgi:hypothetical protein
MVGARPGMTGDDRLDAQFRHRCAIDFRQINEHYSRESNTVKINDEACLSQLPRPGERNAS